jgi:hypothetical protein
MSQETLHFAAMFLPLMGLNFMAVPLFPAGHQVLPKSIELSEGGVYSKRPPNQGFSALLYPHPSRFVLKLISGSFDPSATVSSRKT